MIRDQIEQMYREVVFPYARPANGLRALLLRVGAPFKSQPATQA
jgi:hypothetical protein